MARHVFYSLHYDADRERAELIRKLAGFSPNLEVSREVWASTTRSGAFAVKRWLEQQLRGRSCTIVLIGAHTATRPWVEHEIRRSAELKLGLLGVHIHALRDSRGKDAAKGANPFEAAGPELAARARVYDPPDGDSKAAYRFIADNLERWVERAVAESSAA